MSTTLGLKGISYLVKPPVEICRGNKLSIIPVLFFWLLLLPHADGGSAENPSTVSFFGLKWGTPISKFRGLGMTIEEEWRIWDRGMAVRVQEIPTSPPNTGSMILVFDQEYGLVKIHWAGNPIQRDQNGKKGIEEYEEFKIRLSEQYGSPTESQEQPTVKLNGYHGDFYQCLKEAPCGTWESIWEIDDGGTIILELVGLNPEVGFLQMTQQGPNLGKILERMQSQDMAI